VVIKGASLFAGSEGWYAWSILIPEEGYPDDPDPSHWQILAQFHDQPNADLGKYKQ
jgi:hypothetical protein